MTRVSLGALAAALALAACTNDAAAPGLCPQFCPQGSLTVVDTFLTTAINRDSAFGRPFGYSNPTSSLILLAAAIPGFKDSRPIMQTGALPTQILVGPDTTTGTVIGVDSLMLRFTIATPDTAIHNLTFALYALPLGIDSTTTFGALAGPFSAAPIRTLNLSRLLALSGYKDPVVGDSAIVDTTDGRITVYMVLDSAQAPYSAPDTGKLAFGIRVSATGPAEAAIAAIANTGLGPGLAWYLKVDSLGLSVAHRTTPPFSPLFDSFVFDPPALPLDSNLLVGGMPAARSLLRVAFPRTLFRDSLQISRATLELVPAVAAQGLPLDSFKMIGSGLIADLGAKSPLDPLHVDTVTVGIGSTDTVHLDVTSILRFWATDTLAPTAFMLRQSPEGGTFSEVRFYSSAAAPYRPVLHVTYSPAYPFGVSDRDRKPR